VRSDHCIQSGLANGAGITYWSRYPVAEVTTLDQLGALASVDTCGLRPKGEPLDTNSDSTPLAISSRAAMLLLPGGAEFRATDAHDHQAAAYPEDDSLEHKTQHDPIVQFDRPNQGNGKT
jgi:hypothetical protein